MLTDLIRHVHADFRGVYGYRRVHAELTLGYGIHAGHEAVTLLMQRAYLQGASGRPRWRRTAHPRAPQSLHQNQGDSPCSRHEGAYWPMSFSTLHIARSTGVGSV